jgi:flagellin-like hook-associated protein FlgL
LPIDFDLTDEVTITADTMFDFDVLLDNGTTILATNNVPAGSVLAIGNTIPAGTELPFAVTLAAGETIPINTMVPAGTVIPANTEIPAGTMIRAGTEIPNNTVIIPAGVVMDTGTWIPAGMMLPAGTEVPWRSYDMDNQALKFELGLNTQVQINSLAKDVLTPQLFADLKNLVEFTNSVHVASEDEIRARLLADMPELADDPAELAKRVGAQVMLEEGMFRDVLFDRFNNMLRILDVHAAQITTEFTILGSRMNRLELIEERLEQDRLSYTRLMSENENVDYMEVIMRLNSAEAVYQASLMAGANIMQLTLADFIR